MSKIEWTDVTWNPVTGCDRISAGCDNCYALTLAKRLHSMGVQKYQNQGDPRTSGPGFDVALHPDSLQQPLAWKTPRRVFVNSMSDLFHARVPASFIGDVFEVVRATPRHQYQVLTKRPNRASRLKLDWPDNLLLGVSVEDGYAKQRLDILRRINVRTRFVSAEPLLEDLGEVDLRCIDWLIVGGESGVGARPLDPSWVRNLRDQAQKARVPFFFKQWGGRTAKAGGRELDGRLWDEYPRL